MNRFYYRTQLVKASLFMLAVAYVLPLSAENSESNLAFKPEMFKQFQTYARRGPNYADIEKAFVAFTPSTPEQVDWCYLACNNNVSPSIRTLAQEKLAALRDPVLLAASRKHLFDQDKEAVWVALKTIVATNDQAALSDLRKLEEMKTETAKRVYFRVRQTRAKLHGQDLLKELTNPQKQTPDSTLAQYNRQLLKEYGKEGAKLLLEMEQNSKASKEQVDHYLSEIKDAEQVPDLLERYHSSSIFRSEESDNSRRTAILMSLLRINSSECQPLFRKILATPEKERRQFEDNQIQRIRMCVWKYNTKESEKLQDQYITDLKREKGAIMYSLYWPEMKDKTPEIALILAGKLNSKENGYLAAQALKRVTGQKFQYARPDSDWARKQANERGRKTSLTPKEIEEERQLALDALNHHLSELGNDSRRASFEKERRSSIKSKYDTLLESAAKPSEWEQGIPIDEAIQWLMNYYHIQAEEETKNERD